MRGVRPAGRMQAGYKRAHGFSRRQRRTALSLGVEEVCQDSEPGLDGTEKQGKQEQNS